VIVTCPNHPTPSTNPSEYRLGRSARESLSGVLSAGLEQEKPSQSSQSHNDSLRQESARVARVERNLFRPKCQGHSADCFPHHIRTKTPFGVEVKHAMACHRQSFSEVYHPGLESSQHMPGLCFVTRPNAHPERSLVMNIESTTIFKVASRVSE
jgi:hypothetical protein